MDTYQESRSIFIRLMLDANRINARQGDPTLNQIERWREDGVVEILMAETAYNEARAGNSSQRRSKVATHLYSMTLANTSVEQNQLQQISSVLFPNGIECQSERNDVDIVFNALKYNAILVTNDGGSKRQPRGILGSREELRCLGITVMRSEEVAAHIRQKIAERDSRARQEAQMQCTPVPDWVGRD